MTNTKREGKQKKINKAMRRKEKNKVSKVSV
jgi:hypothetical protein